MKINFTKKEYRFLIELLYLGDWMIHAHDTDIRQETRGYKELEQKLYGLAKEFGAEDLVEYSKEFGEYFPTKKLEEDTNVREFIEEYDDNSFWQELINRLVDRDLLAQVGEDVLEQMELEDFLEKSMPIEERYSEEFAKYGLGRVQIGGA